MVQKHYKDFGADSLARLLDGELRVGLADKLDGITHASGVTVCGGDRNGIDTAFDKGTDMLESTVAVDFTEGIAGGGDGGSADKAEERVAGGLELGARFLSDAFDIAESEEAVQTVIIVDDEEFVDAGVASEELVGDGDGIRVEFLLADGVYLVAGNHGLID